MKVNDFIETCKKGNLQGCKKYSIDEKWILFSGLNDSVLLDQN